LLHKAHNEGIEKGTAEGFAQGLTQGQQDGHAAALNEYREKFRDVLSALTSSVIELDASRQRLELEATTEVLQLAISIARRVTHRLARQDSSVVCDSVAEAMKMVVLASDVRIAINPQERAVLTETLPRLQVDWPATKHVELIDDPTIGVGGCRILTANGEVNADLDQQIDRIAAELIPEGAPT
jgi:flagellar assembly protein FliH